MKQISGDKRGYLKVNLLSKSIRKTFRVHRMTASHFCKKENGRNVVNHLNFRIRDNFYKNLEWTTPRGNVEHYFSFGEVKINKGSEVPNSKLKETDIPKIRNEFFLNKKTRLEISEMFGVKKQTITDVISKRS